MAHALQIVIIRILRQSSVHKRPRQVIHRILLVLNCLRDNLSVEVIVHAMIQVTLDRQRLIKEFLEEIFLGILTHQHALGVVVVDGPVGASNHLQDIRDRVVFVAVNLSVVELRVHDDDEMGGDVEAPGELTSDNGDLEIVKKLLNFRKIMKNLQKFSPELRRNRKVVRRADDPMPRVLRGCKRRPARAFPSASCRSFSR
jgi:hypothetical protein